MSTDPNNKLLDCIDGNAAACHVAYAMSETCFIYPITPSSAMAELADVWASQKRKNVVSNLPVTVTQMQSEGGASGALHGAAAAGALVTTFTASQGLMLMVPVMYKIAGELLPVVFHVAARQVASTSNSIFGDHSDVMATRSTGVCLLSSHSVQEVMDLALVSHVASLRGSLPVLHFFDGFQLSHEIQKVNVIPYSTMASLVDQSALERHRSRAINPTHPRVRSLLNGRDTLFQATEANNRYWMDFPAVVEQAMIDVARAAGRSTPYHLFEYKGAPDAERLIVLMGAGAQAVGECIDYLCARGEKVGCVAVHLFRPWSLQHFAAVIPKTTKAIAVLDRCREPGSLGEPLFLDVSSSIAMLRIPALVVGGRYGLGDKMFTPAMVKAVFDHIKNPSARHNFTVGINDDVTHLSLEVGPDINTVPVGTTQCIFWGLGSDGTVGANRVAISLIGKNTDLYAQGYFFFTAHKAGGVTMSHLRFGSKMITSSYPIVSDADYIACHQPSYISKFPLMIEPLKTGGVFLLNCTWSLEEVGSHIPAFMKRQIAQRRAKFFIINAHKISRETKLGGHINLIMQVCFFKLSQVMDFSNSLALLKQSIEQTYFKKGTEIIQQNKNAIDRAVSELFEVAYPDSWATETEKFVAKRVNCGEESEWINNVKFPADAMLGESLPVSAFSPLGVTPTGTTRFEKRGIATQVPVWNPNTCVQCATCSFVCPHAVIRPFLLTNEEATGFPGLECKPAKGIASKDLLFRIQVSPYDCTGCGVCIKSCPVPGTLSFAPIESVAEQQEPLWQYCSEKVSVKLNQAPLSSLKGTQLIQPLFEFCGACAGCGEAPYLKLLSSLFGERLSLGNAAGCSGAIAIAFPSSPYTKNKQSGWGPCLSNSLFENAAEFSLGTLQGHEALRDKLMHRIKDVLEDSTVLLSSELRNAFTKWLGDFTDSFASLSNSKLLSSLLEGEHTSNPVLAQIWKERDALPKIAHWAVGGDGWAYDIDFGGLDHVLSLGKEIKAIVLDTEVYSNTGGQKSKGSAKGSVSKFASGGHTQNKKDFGSIIMSYENVYVAQVALYANPMQTIRAFLEADAYPGSAVVICYCPCIEHGIEGDWVSQVKLAVASGYWPLYRYNPSLRAEGKNPLQLDSRAPTREVSEFIARENRFLRLTREHPETAALLHPQLVETTQRRFRTLQQRAAESSITTPSSTTTSTGH
ncbi:pyruvate:ferredoxin oxidoreductase [Pelomyxa schiedti]|nr:pyruvate:ferredoxin oxidoreductase [Pelomyxa schiedti]